MTPTPRARFAPAALLLALAGTWVAHTLEYVRVEGDAGLRGELTGSLHVYMLPVALALVVAGLALGHRCWLAWSALGRRLDRATGAVTALLGGRPVVWEDEGPSPSVEAAVVVLWLTLGSLQVALYLLQENLEALRAGLPAPGIGAVSGTHWAAVPIHMGVALAVALGLSALARRWRTGVAAVCATEARIRRLLERARRAPAGRRAATPWIASLFSRMGRSLWRRPPPALRAT